MVNECKNNKVKTLKKLSDVSDFNQTWLINENKIISCKLQITSFVASRR
ncbi:hypothetical protein HMPREF9455_00320 [Dysgonomonas gadei ATCC BAA-286]|uniref:Uncharacterized protein n=1 Tax=Dysgonomonas gadei ATCC BAA-286 TaxID=742766 RepID=F5ITA3_9BACT|nr:hypothetical protein HMPREF9455_00320 [Dysgonomonas gadei ATCC BAA-286]